MSTRSGPLHEQAVVVDPRDNVAVVKHDVVEGAVFPYLVRIRDDVRAVEGRIQIKKSAGNREAPVPHVIALPKDQLGTHETGGIQRGT